MLYVWFEKKLYRYPFSSFGRYFGLKEIKPVNGNYRVCRDWVSKSKLLNFEELGVDRLYVDEGHEFRKLDFPTLS